MDRKAPTPWNGIGIPDIRSVVQFLHLGHGQYRAVTAWIDQAVVDDGMSVSCMRRAWLVGTQS